jgi:pseudaminic acid cytidylyltransferase
MNICVIPARGGSKRIQKKNIQNFNGKPIISYSIRAALESKCFDQVIVSTDDSEITEVAKKYGAEVPFIRPSKLSNDYADTVSVIKHAIEWIEKNGKSIEKVCCLYATAPFIKAQVITKALQQLQDSNADYCFSVTNFASPVQRSIRINKKTRVEMVYPEQFGSRSQDLEKIYHDAGQFYWGKSQAFKSGTSLFSEVATPYILPRYLVQDIDTKDDWVRAEVMYRALQETNVLP